jgi:vacuolar-type H+-ATPase subunit D/Vma8
VKSVDQMTMMGKTVPIFRIVMTGGKIYNFGGLSQSEKEVNQAVKLIKKKLGK